MSATLRFVRSLTEIIAVLGLVVLLAYAFLTVADATLRAFAGTSLTFVRDSGKLIVAVAGASCLPFVIVERGNITLRVFEGMTWKMPSRGADYFAAVVVFVILLGMAQQFWKYAMNAMHAGESTWVLAIPHAPFYFYIAAMLWLCVIVKAALLSETTLGFFRKVTDQ